MADTSGRQANAQEALRLPALAEVGASVTSVSIAVAVLSLTSVPVWAVGVGTALLVAWSFLIEEATRTPQRRTPLFTAAMVVMGLGYVFLLAYHLQDDRLGTRTYQMVVAGDTTQLLSAMSAPFSDTEVRVIPGGSTVEVECRTNEIITSSEGARSQFYRLDGGSWVQVGYLTPVPGFASPRIPVCPGALPTDETYP